MLTSEIVTNALVHGTGDITFGFQAENRMVRVEVGDDDTRRPRVCEVQDDGEGGRGMQIVQVLASAWGVLDRPPGKLVWFTVAAQP